MLPMPVLKYCTFSQKQAAPLSTRQAPDRAIVEIGSGDYRFTVR